MKSRTLVVIQRHQFSSVTRSCSTKVSTICDPMYCSTPGFSVHQQLSELAQTHVHQVGNAIQSSHPLSSPSPPAFNLSQHQGLFQWVGFFSLRSSKYWQALCLLFRTFFFFQVKRPVLLEVLHRMWFPDSSPLLILLCTSSHRVPLGYDESFMSVVLRVHHGVWTVRFCHHWVRLCCHQEYQPGGGTGWDTVKGRLAAIFIGICGYAPKASMRE